MQLRHASPRATAQHRFNCLSRSLSVPGTTKFVLSVLNFVSLGRVTRCVSQSLHGDACFLLSVGLSIGVCNVVRPF